MDFKRFIDRPLLAIVISIVLLTMGIISLMHLPIEKYPEIAPPTIYVWASYPGASADAVRKTVVAPLEEAINGVENMIYMTSSASNGSASITIYFRQGTNADLAAINVQNRVSQAQESLPSEVVRNGVTTQKQQPGQLRTLALESPLGTYDEKFLSNYFHNNIQTALLRIPGVGKVEVFGAQYALRIWLKPEAMAARGLVPSDITSLLEEQNTEISLGAIGENSENTFQYALNYSGRKTSIEEFENMVISSTPSGEELRLKDVADVELGLNDYSFRNQINGHKGVMGIVSQTAGSNATEINLAIDRLIEDLRHTLPKDIRIVTFDNTNDFLFAAIHEVVLTLAIAILLVLLVVYLFLHDIKATIIPAIGILVSLVGTFAFLHVAGFSINLITLFALVLVIGTVVDDSIVVVEAVRARIDTSSSNASEAAKESMESLSSALFSTTLVFMSVFLPVSFMGGVTGIFYKQFGITMAIAVGLSFINAITLSSALCALLFSANNHKREGFQHTLKTAFDTGFHALIHKYTKGISKLVEHPKMALGGTLATILLTVLLFNWLPTGFIPDEDMGAINIDISAPAGYTQQKTEEIANRIALQLEALEDVQEVGCVVGFSFSGTGSNYAMCFVQLKPWKERGSMESVLEQINEILDKEHEASTFTMTQEVVDGFGNGGGFEFSVLNKNGAEISKFNEVTELILDHLNAREEIEEARSGYEVNYPQYNVEVDVSRCKKMGISPATVLNELSAYMGSSYASNINLYNKVYQVSLQLKPENRSRIEDLSLIHVRNQEGVMQPIDQFITLKKEYKPQVINALNQTNSISVTGSMADGFSSGEAIQAIQEVATRHLPIGYGIELTGITREEALSSSNVPFILFISLFFIYLVMVALYESLLIPLAVILSVPFGMAGALLFAKLFGVENNIYLQVGLIMTTGLLCKTAILLTDYASQCRECGMTITQAAIFSAQSRLRPILMTSLTLIIGMLPLMVANGVGANGSRTLGCGVVGGMIIGTLGIVFFTPILFIVFQHLQERFKPITSFKSTNDRLIIQALDNTQPNNRMQ